MIGRLKGIVDAFGDDFVILDVGGVGYEVHCSTRTLQDLPKPGEAAAMSIETVVREDLIRLYGFSTAAERAWFRLLTTVQGVGTKVALAILSTLRPAELASAIALGDKAMIARAPGVGPKVAQRIAAELKDRAPALLGRRCRDRSGDCAPPGGPWRRRRGATGGGRGICARQSRLCAGAGQRGRGARAEGARRGRGDGQADPGGVEGAGGVSAVTHGSSAASPRRRRRPIPSPPG